MAVMLAATCCADATDKAERANASAEGNATNAPVTVLTGEEKKPARAPTVVTSDRLQVDYAKNIGVFEGNVLAVDPQITVRADKMTVTFGGATGVESGETGTNAPPARSLQQIVAEGGVVISQDERKATGEHAVYTAADGKVVLTGNPKVVTKDGTVTGKKITFWRNEDKMDVESGSQLIFYPEDRGKDKPAGEKPDETTAPKSESK